MLDTIERPVFVPAGPQALVIAHLLQVNRLLGDALLQIIEEASLFMDCNVCMSTAKEALAQVAVVEHT